MANNARTKYDYEDAPRKTKKETTPVKAFLKLFLIVLGCCTVAISIGLGLWDNLLDTTPMIKDTGNVAVAGTTTPEQTEEKMNILIKASGVFKNDEDFKNSKRVNIVLLGDTSMTSEAGLTDTMMLASFDPDTQKFDLISVPRDTYYERENYNSGGYLKINSVLESEGIRTTCKAIHNVLQGVQINYYAIIKYGGIKEIVDAIGGVEVDVPFHLKYTDKKQNLYIDVPEGKQKLDGEKAIQFLRFRKGYPEGDIGRVHAQQTFVMNALKQSIGPNLPNIAQTVVDNVESDVNLRAILYLATKATGMDKKDVKSWELPGDYSYINGLSFWVKAPDEDVVDMMREVYTGQKATTEGAIDTPDVSNDDDSESNG